jgi:tetratricopeptide (TPR) repeat protein
VFVALLELWDPALTREVARAARVTTNFAGSYLDRLERRGAVKKEGGRWQATERLFNIYYLMRRRGAPASRVQALVRFMTVYYEPDQLARRVRELAAEACHLKPAERQDHYYAVSALVTQFAPGEQRRVLLALPRDFFQDPNLPAPIVRLRALQDEVSTASLATKASKGSGRKASDAARLEAIAKLLDAEDLDAAEETATAFVRESGGSVTSLFAMALVNLTRNRHQQAEEWAQRALAADPDHLPTWQFLTTEFLAQDRTAEAVEAARHVIKLDGSEASQWMLLGRALAAADENSESIEAAYRKALEIDPDLPDALVGLAKIAVDRGELVQAHALYEQAVNFEPIGLPTINAYADFLAKVVDDDAAAEKVLRRITELFPERPSVWIRLAFHIGSDLERQEETLGLLKTATELPNSDPRAWVAYANYLNFVDRVDEAERAWRHAVELDPEAAELWVRFGRFLQRNDLESEAEKAFLKAIELKPDDGEAWEYLGVLLLDQSDRSKAAESALLKAIERSPTSCSPAHALGRLYEKEGRFAEADLQYRKALELRPECGCALEALMSKRSGYGAHLPDGEALIEKLLKQYPRQARARLVHARFLRFAKNDLKAARAEILVALSLSNADRDVWAQAAEILVETQPDSISAVKEFTVLVEKYKPCEHMLNFAAWRLHLVYGARATVLALAIAKQAQERDPESWQIAHTLAAIHIDASDADATLALMPFLLAKYRGHELSGLIDVIIDLARLDEAARPKLLDAIESAHRDADLEPLVVALRIISQQTVHVAKEVLEVANDIVVRIRAKAAVRGTPIRNAWTIEQQE